ncbi:MAG: cation transporter [Lentisphaeria bacterium]|nr:cation transporter [Lentisphaeria bacterium]
MSENIVMTERQRLRSGRIASITGILVNLLLFVIKIVIGISAKSVALAADAVNNFTDAASSGISLLGFNIAAKPADDEHPFGHGRMEDIAALIVAVIVTAIGLDFGKSAIEKILNPSVVELNIVQTGFVLLTVFFKIGLFFYFRYVGRKIDSLSLQGAAFDSLSDILGTLTVLASVGVGYLWGWQLDGWAGLIVAIIILRGGFGLIKETVEPLLGGCPDKELVDEMKNILMENPAIHGVHDIILHSYGHNRYFATAHAELSVELSSTAAHDILEQAEIEVSQRIPVTLVLHCDPFNTDDPELKNWRVCLENKIAEIDALLKLYDFKMEKNNDKVYFYFHLLTPRKYSGRENEILNILYKHLSGMNIKPELHVTFVNSFVK